MLTPLLRLPLVDEPLFDCAQNSEIAERMSPSQLVEYRANEWAIVLIATILIASAIVAALIITITNIQMELYRAKQSDLNSKARRLRYVATHLSVPAPPIEPGHFHIFLSHVWGTGQDQSTRAAPQTTDSPAASLAAHSRRVRAPSCGQCASSRHGCSR